MSKFAEDTQKKKPQPTPEWASAEALGSNYRLQIKVETDIYSVILRRSVPDRKTYGAVLFHRSQGKKILDFQPLS